MIFGRVSKMNDASVTLTLLYKSYKKFRHEKLVHHSHPMSSIFFLLLVFATDT